MKKAIFVFLSASLISGANCMEQDSQDPGNARDRFGRTPLFYATAILEDQAKNEKQLKALDLSRAHIAAFLIIEFYSDVDAADSQGLTPLKLAETQKEKLPHVYKVMVAGKKKKECEKKLPKPDEQGAYDFNELLQFRNANQSVGDEWGEAMEVLLSYLPDKKK